jgi:hypothetical protein
VTVSNFYAAILGDKDGIQGGSGKVVASGPNDHIFIFYTDHGGAGVLGAWLSLLSMSCAHLCRLRSSLMDSVCNFIIFFVSLTAVPPS